MASTLSSIRNDRLAKLKKLKELGINPFASKIKIGKNLVKIVDAKNSFEKKVLVAGRIWSLRFHGGVVFADLGDSSGKIQLLFQKKVLKEEYEQISLLDIGDFFAVEGKVIKTSAGEITVDVVKFQFLSKAIRVIPSSWYGLKDVEERYRQRYIDLLLNEEIRKTFDTRTKIVSEIRRFMDENGFSEVETPILQPLYGGASAQPFVTHHNVLDIDLYLRISDELYLKRLIVGGYEKVYEIGRVFRNEGIDRSHNPEFTMIEFYWAYADYQDLIDYSEKMLSSIIKSTNGSLFVKHEEDNLDFTPPWPRKTFRELLLENINIDLDEADDEEKLRKALKEKKIKVDLEGVVGYGDLCDKLYKLFIRPKIIQPTLVLDYPAAMIALAKRKEDDPRKIASFQLVVKGAELIKAYNELNDPIDQKERWLSEEKLGKKGLETHMVVDEDYIQALEYGMPPTAGWGMGIDRLTAVLANQHNIKDTILFPTLKPKNK